MLYPTGLDSCWGSCRDVSAVHQNWKQFCSQTSKWRCLLTYKSRCLCLLHLSVALTQFSFLRPSSVFVHGYTMQLFWGIREWLYQSTWKDLASKKRAETKSKIPKDWILEASVLS